MVVNFSKPEALVFAKSLQVVLSARGGKEFEIEKELAKSGLICLLVISIVTSCSCGSG